MRDLRDLLRQGGGSTFMVWCIQTAGEAAIRRFAIGGLKSRKRCHR
jgi:hypothetical protein